MAGSRLIETFYTLYHQILRALATFLLLQVDHRDRRDFDKSLFFVGDDVRTVAFPSKKTDCHIITKILILAPQILSKNRSIAFILLAEI
ncbi:hypothetical protein B0E34_20360 [Chryseobacterium mucoviscidosis]|uniref:Uncharacterized protein n=1 Tax=Chryseobacterium mucoviscidosis TaxID=1945581 RepID=A0A202BR80_9FLAO|nr:hypothetical protein B0E34_20360 [Chryseobacterium mucoviscidosis]